MFTLRFDMRAPAGGAPTTELYAAALDMASWAETRGATLAFVSEHHAMRDGYLPSPLVLAAALAARTTTLPIMTMVMVLPLYDPIRLAEDMVVLDIVSGGRVSYVAGVGYVPEEYELHGVDFHRRGRIADEKLEVLLRAKTGEPFEHEGRRLRITPAPVTPGGPRVGWGGGSIAAASRAGRHGLDFYAQHNDAALAETYAAAARENGHEPGFCFLPPQHMATTLFVAHDVDAAWDELGPYLMHDVVNYAGINEVGIQSDPTASFSAATSVQELRAEKRSHRILSVDEAVEMVRSNRPLFLHPLVGGLPPDIAWRYLRTVTDDVMPHVS